MATKTASSIRAWAQLFRVPNTFTALADVVAGFSIVHGPWSADLLTIASLTLAGIASICLYWSGMALNDVYDIEIDRKNNRPGPIVDGRIALASARIAGYALMFVGVALATIAGWMMPTGITSQRWLMPTVAVGLAISIIAYDGWLKKTPIAPFVMGLCRGLNLSLGISLGVVSTGSLTNPSMQSAGLIAIGYVLYITGITVAARREESSSQSSIRLIGGWSTCVVGLVLIAFSSTVSKSVDLRLDPYTAFPILILFLMIPWARHAIDSIRTGSKQFLGLAIRQAILSILFIDAALAVQFSGIAPGATVCLFVIPTMLLARIFRTT